MEQNPLNYISVDDLSSEIQKHHDSDLLRTLLADLRAKRVDLKEFCKRVRMLIGANVLVATVRGLQAAQRQKLLEKQSAPGGAAAAAPAAPFCPACPVGPAAMSAASTLYRPGATPPLAAGALSVKAEPLPSSLTLGAPVTLPHLGAPVSQLLPLRPLGAPVAMSGPPTLSTADGDALVPPLAPPPQVPAASDALDPAAGKNSGERGTKLLIHALLCSRPGTCAMPECKTMKGFLERVESHTKTCNYSNLPGGQSDCANCAKWQQMVKLREHYRRKLINHARAAKEKQDAHARLQHGVLLPPQPAQLPHAARPPPPGAPSLGRIASSPFGAPVASPFGVSVKREGAASSAMPPMTMPPAAQPAHGLSLFGPPQGHQIPMVDPNPNAAPGAWPGAILHNKPKVAAPSARQNHGLVALPHAAGRQPSLEDIVQGGLPAGSAEADDLDALLEAELLQKDQRLDKPGGKPGGKRPAEHAPGGGRGAKAAKKPADGKKPVQQQQQPSRGARHGKPHPMIDGGGDDDDDMGGGMLGLPPLHGASGLKPRVGSKPHPSMGSLFAELHAGTTDAKFMEIIDTARPLDGGGGFRPTEADTAVNRGMHLVVDANRPSSATGPIPTAHHPIAVAARPDQTNVATVERVHADGSCDVRFVCNCHEAAWPPSEQSVPSTSCQTCGAGRVARHLQPTQRQIVCSHCLDVNLAHQQPQLRCSGCEKLIKNDAHYYRETELHREVKLCTTCYGELKDHNERPQLLADLELHAETFQKQVWKASDEEDYDQYVQCEGECKRWYHFTCCMYPDPAQLPQEWSLEKQRFLCPVCRKKAPTSEPSLQLSSKLFELVDRRAAQTLPTCPMTDAIEAFVAEECATARVGLSGLSVRLVSSKQFKYQAVSGMRQRYGDSFPGEFPYASKALLAFQTVDGHDVVFFSMYVQEYGAHCPQPNTNRTYISYLDSVRYLRTEPPEQRTLVYHAIINGYLKHACARGFEYAHIWVAPPQAGDEYVFHCRPRDAKHGDRRMGMSKLRSWYETMLQHATARGIVKDFTDIQSTIEHLTSIREFPMFEGDFFPEQLQQLITQPQAEGRGDPRGDGRGGGAGPSLQNTKAPGLRKQDSYALMEQIKKQVRAVRKRFLVARLDTARWQQPAAQAEVEMELSHELVDSRMSFLGQCQHQHWQFNTLNRAHYTTMMLLARLGGMQT